MKELVVVADDVQAEVDPEDAVLRGLLGDMRRERHRASTRRRLAALGGGLALAAGSFALGQVFGPSSGAPVRRPAMTAAATDPVTGISANLGTEQRNWGTQVVLDLRDDQGPRACALVVVDRKGIGSTIGSWTDPAIVGQLPSGAVSITAATALRLPAIDHFEVRSDTGRLLLAIRP